ENAGESVISRHEKGVRRCNCRISLGERDVQYFLCPYRERSCTSALRIMPSAERDRVVRTRTSAREAPRIYNYCDIRKKNLLTEYTMFHEVRIDRAKVPTGRFIRAALSMFENGSLLRRRKRFKLHKPDKELLKTELQALAQTIPPPRPGDRLGQSVGRNGARLAAPVARLHLRHGWTELGQSAPIARGSHALGDAGARNDARGGCGGLHVFLDVAGVRRRCAGTADLRGQPVELRVQLLPLAQSGGSSAPGRGRAAHGDGGSSAECRRSCSRMELLLFRGSDGLLLEQWGLPLLVEQRNGCGSTELSRQWRFLCAREARQFRGRGESVTATGLPSRARGPNRRNHDDDKPSGLQHCRSSRRIISIMSLTAINTSTIAVPTRGTTLTRRKSSFCQCHDRFTHPPRASDFKQGEEKRKKKSRPILSYAFRELLVLFLEANENVEFLLTTRIKNLPSWLRHQFHHFNLSYSLYWCVYSSMNIKLNKRFQRINYRYENNENRAQSSIRLSSISRKPHSLVLVSSEPERLSSRPRRKVAGTVLGQSRFKSNQMQIILFGKYIKFYACSRRDHFFPLSRHGGSRERARTLYTYTTGSRRRRLVLCAHVFSLRRISMRAVLKDHFFKRGYKSHHVYNVRQRIRYYKTLPKIKDQAARASDRFDERTNSHDERGRREREREKTRHRNAPKQWPSYLLLVFTKSYIYALQDHVVIKKWKLHLNKTSKTVRKRKNFRSQKNGTLTTRSSRMLWNGIGMVVPALSLLVLAYTNPENPVFAIALLYIGITTNITIYSGHHANHLDLSSNYAGLLMGIMNTIANLGAAAAPLSEKANSYNNDTLMICVSSTKNQIISIIAETVADTSRKIKLKFIENLSARCCCCCTRTEERASGARQREKVRNVQQQQQQLKRKSEESRITESCRGEEKPVHAQPGYGYSNVRYVHKGRVYHRAPSSSLAKRRSQATRSSTSRADHRSKKERKKRERKISRAKLDSHITAYWTVADFRKEREKKTITQNSTLEHRPSHARFTPRALSQVPPPPPMLLLLEASFRVMQHGSPGNVEGDENELARAAEQAASPDDQQRQQQQRPPEECEECDEDEVESDVIEERAEANSAVLPLVNLECGCFGNRVNEDATGRAASGWLVTNSSPTPNRRVRQIAPSIALAPGV
ncbi:unnamed protein product, partial [Trichogramma brassicae]